MIATRQPMPLALWRRRFGGKHRQIDHPRHAALGYMAEGPVEDGLIQVADLTIVILYPCQLRSGLHALRLAGFSGAAVPWGVRWGGDDQRRFLKDILLQPVAGGPGLRLNVANADLLTLALQLDRERDRAVRLGKTSVREQVQLPKLWAAFNRAEAASITGDGPELAASAARANRSPEDQFHRLRREHNRMVLWPLAWASHCWRQAVAIYADLDRFPRRQVFRLENLPDDLAGFRDAAEFDFVSRAPLGSQQRSRRPHEPVLASAV